MNYLRDVLGVKWKKVPESLLHPLPMQNASLEQLREQKRAQCEV